MSNLKSTAAMAEVIAAHALWMSGETETVWQPAEESAQCSCGHEYDGWVHTAGGDGPPDWDKDHAAHVVEELARAGYGNVADAWDEGATAGWKQSGEGFNAEYPDESFGGCSVDLSSNPYRESPNGLD